MKSRTNALRAALILISLPVLLVLAEAASFYAGNRENGSIVSSGERRKYELYVPRSYDRSLPTPLVISMHGAAGWPIQQMSLTGWSTLAESQRFIVVYPAGTEGDGPRIWHVEQEPGLARDVRFISDLLDKLEATYNIDRKRIYANGFSNGGGMSFVLSCTLSDRIAAVGMVGAAQTLPWSWCTERRAVPMILFHGTEDPFVPYKGGKSWIAPDPFPNVPNWAKNWARRNRCEPRPVEAAIAAGVTRREYTNCADGASVVFYTISGGGHTWPGGEPLPEWFAGPTSRNIDATREMWAFFCAHPLSTK